MESENMNNEAQTFEIRNFLDDEGRIKALPKKHDKRIAVLAYLGEKFEAGVTYSEREVNEIIDRWHTFGDLFILRREMADSGLLSRERDGSAYWREAPVTGDKS